MNHKCLVVIVIRNQPRRSAKSGSSEPDSLASLPQTDTHLSLEERNAGHVKCLGKLLCSHLPPVETVNVLEVVRQVQLLLTGTGWLSLVNSRVANRANKQAAEKKGPLVSPGGKPETESHQWLHQPRSGPLAKTLRHSKSKGAYPDTGTEADTHTHTHTHMQG